MVATFTSCAIQSKTVQLSCLLIYVSYFCCTDMMYHIREAPLKFTRGHLGIARKGGGGLDPCPDGLGHFFREEFAKIKWAFAWFWGGLNPCQDGLGHLCSENGSSIRYFPLLTRDLRLARILCGTYIPSKQWFDKVAQIGPEKSAPECPFECGGGGAKAKRAMPKCPPREFEWGFPYYQLKGLVSFHPGQLSLHVSSPCVALIYTIRCETLIWIYRLCRKLQNQH